MDNVNITIDDSTGEWICSENGEELWREADLEDARIRLDYMSLCRAGASA